MADYPTQTFSDHLFEIRYRPNARILDKRGEWAEQISSHMGLPRWKIIQNRFDVFDETTGHRAFVSFNNSGFSVANSPSANFFPDQVLKFFKRTLALEGFPVPLSVGRIGVRQKFVTAFEGKFDELVSLFSSRYLCLTKDALTAIDGKLIDIGGPLNFADQHGNFNTSCGPVPRAQADEMVSTSAEELPEVGLFYDIDYWLQPNREMPEKEILKTIRTFAIEGWNRHNRVRELILRGKSA